MESLSTNANQKNLQTNKSCFDYKLNLDDNKYSIKINSEEKAISFICQNITQLSNYGYKNKYSLEDLIKLNKLFLYFSSGEEILSIFSELFKKEKISIQKENENIQLIIKLSNIAGEEEKVILILNKATLDKDELDCNYIMQINELKIILEEQRKKNENLSKRVEALEGWRKKKEMEEMEELKNKINSNIIENSKEINFIIDRLKNTDDKKLKNIFFKKIYSAKEDGDSTSIFHQKCDGIKNVITFFKTIKGAKFGVYVQVGFGLGEGVHIADDEIFLFNINNRKIYNVKKGLKEAARCGQNICGVHIQNGISTSYNYLSGDNNHFIQNNMKNYYDGVEKEFEINLGEKYFISSEVEVFQIIFY